MNITISLLVIRFQTLCCSQVSPPPRDKMAPPCITQGTQDTHGTRLTTFEGHQNGAPLYNTRDPRNARHPSLTTSEGQQMAPPDITQGTQDTHCTQVSPPPTDKKMAPPYIAYIAQRTQDRHGTQVSTHPRDNNMARPYKLNTVILNRTFHRITRVMEGLRLSLLMRWS